MSVQPQKKCGMDIIFKEQLLKKSQGSILGHPLSFNGPLAAHCILEQRQEKKENCPFPVLL